MLASDVGLAFPHHAHKAMVPTSLVAGASYGMKSRPFLFQLRCGSWMLNAGRQSLGVSVCRQQASGTNMLHGTLAFRCVFRPPGMLCRCADDFS